MKLHQQRRVLVRSIRDAQDEMQRMAEYLTSAKFEWPEDWVRIWEVLESVGRTSRVLAGGLEICGVQRDGEAGD